MATEHDMDVAAEAADHFIPAFYHAVNEMSPLSSFYTTSCARYAGMLPLQIAINGHVLSSPSEYETLLSQQANEHPKRVVHEVSSVDAQVINPKFVIGAPDWVLSQVTNPLPSLPAKDRVDCLGIMVLLSGSVRYGPPTDREAPPPRSFTETLFLVPNWDAVGRNGKGRKWLIASQNWRAL